MTLRNLPLLFAVALTLAACGVKGPPVPPEGEEARFTFPGTYPAPVSVVPAAPPVATVTPVPAPFGDRRSTTVIFSNQ